MSKELYYEALPLAVSTPRYKHTGKGIVSQNVFCPSWTLMHEYFRIPQQRHSTV